MRHPKRPFLRSFIFAALACMGLSISSTVKAADFVVYSNETISGGGGSVLTSNGNWANFFYFAPSFAGYIDSRTAAPVSPQGGQYIYSTVGANAAYGGQGTVFVVGNGNDTPKFVNMSAYAGGTIRFLLRTDRTVRLVIKWDDGAGNEASSFPYPITTTGNQWVQIEIPISAYGSNIDLSKIRVPFLLEIPGPYSTETQINVDDVRWVEPAGATPVVRPASTRVNPGQRRLFLVDNVPNPNWSVNPSNLGSLSATTGNEIIFTAGSTYQAGTVIATRNGLTGTANVQFLGEDISQQMGLFSETYARPAGLSPDLSIYGDNLGSSLVTQDVSGGDNVREGATSVRTDINVVNGGYAGFAMDWLASTVDLNEYFDGSIRFWFKAPAALNGKISFSIRSGNVNAGGERKIWLHDYVAFDGAWHPVVLPLDRLAGASPKADLSRMKTIFNVTVASNTSGTQSFFIDNLRWDTRRPGALANIIVSPTGTGGVPVRIPKTLKRYFVARGVDAQGVDVDIFPTWSVNGGIGSLSNPTGPRTRLNAVGSAASGSITATDGISGTSFVQVADIVFTQSFNVYSDAGSGGQIGISTNSPAGLLDLSNPEHRTGDAPEGNRVMRATYTLTAPNGFGTWFVYEVEGSRFLSYYGDGYLHFWIRSSRDLEISLRSNNIDPNNNLAKFRLSTLGVPTDGTWQEVWLALDDFKQADPSLDFAQMKVFFGVAAVATQAGLVSNEVFDVDDVKWYTASVAAPDPDKVYAGLKAKQNQTSGLVLTFDNEGLFRAVTYDQALAAMAFTYRREPQFARKILEVYKGKFGSGSGFAGFHEEYDRNNPNIIRDNDRTAGPNAWILLAAVHYKIATGSTDYDAMMAGLATWLISLQDADGAIRLGTFGGSSTINNAKSTEQNFDVYAALRALAAVTGNNAYNVEAEEILSWLNRPAAQGGAFNSGEGRYNVGELIDGSANNDYALDVYSWPPLVRPQTTSVLLNVEALFASTKIVDLNGFPITGFDFSGRPGSVDAPTHPFGLPPDKDAVWIEGTAHMVLAYLAAGNQAKADFYLDQLNKAVFITSQDTQALPYASNAGTAYWYPGVMDSTHGAASSMAWYLFANDGFNPLQPVPFVSVFVKNVVGNAETSQIGWTVAVPNRWVRANQYIELHSQGVDNRSTGWGIQIYTDNKNPAISPRFQDPTPANPTNDDSNPAGLLENVPGVPLTRYRLDMAWKIQDEATSAPAATSPLADSTWLFFKDKGTPGFVPGEAYISVKTNGGIQATTGQFFPTLSPDFIFLEADFMTAAANVNYKTNVTLEYFFQ